MIKVYNQPGIIWPVVTYAPTAATKPNIAAQPLKRSASGVMIIKIWIVNIVTTCVKVCKVFYGFYRNYDWIMEQIGFNSHYWYVYVSLILQSFAQRLSVSE